MKFLPTVITLIFTVGSIQGLPAGLPRALENVIKTDPHDVERRAVSASSCLTKLYAIVFTTGIPAAGAGTHHAIEILVSGTVRHRRLYDRPGVDKLANKGDLWEFNLSSFGFPDACIQVGDIQAVYIIETNNDGWNIGSVLTLVKDSQNGVGLLTQDFDVNHWIDGNRHQSNRRLQLTFA